MKHVLVWKCDAVVEIYLLVYFQEEYDTVYVYSLSQQYK